MKETHRNQKAKYSQKLRTNLKGPGRQGLGKKNLSKLHLIWTRRGRRGAPKPMTVSSHFPEKKLNIFQGYSGSSSSNGVPVAQKCWIVLQVHTMCEWDSSEDSLTHSLYVLFRLPFSHFSISLSSSLLSLSLSLCPLSVSCTAAQLI